MSASFYDLLKYAHTGIASPSMTAYDNMRALAAFGGGKTQTLTGVPPLSFKSNGKPLISWSMLGNGQQTGTPTPDAPIMPDFCGVRTGNLFDNNIAIEQGTFRAMDGEKSPSERVVRSSFTALSFPPGSYVINASGANAAVVYAYTTNDASGYDRDNTISSMQSLPLQFTTTKNLYFRFAFRNTGMVTFTPSDISNIMFNTGQTALPYEPFGWKIPITCAGQTVPVYLGEVETIRRIKKVVFDGTEPWVLSGTIVYIYNTGTENLSPLICTHFPNVANTGMWNGNNWILQVDISRLGMSGREAWITWLAEQYAAGTPVTVWYVLAEPETAIVNEPLAKIGDYADELHSTDAGVTIPTAKGQNTLTVDTELQPSEMTITFK